VAPTCPAPSAVATVASAGPAPRRSPCERIASLQEVPFGDGEAPYGSLFRVCYAVRSGAVGLIQRSPQSLDVVFEPTRSEDVRVARSLSFETSHITEFNVFSTEDGPVVQVGTWRDLRTVVLGPRPAPGEEALAAPILDHPGKASISDISWKSSATETPSLLLKLELPPLEVNVDSSPDRASNLELTLELPSLFFTPTQATFDDAIHRACDGETVASASGMVLIDAASCARLHGEPVDNILKAVEARCRTLTAIHAGTIANFDRHSPLPRKPATDDGGELTPYDFRRIKRESSIENDDQRPPHSCFAEADREWDTKIPLRIPGVHLDPAWRKLLEEIHPPRI
jgi:hypothetical protein